MIVLIVHFLRTTKKQRAHGDHGHEEHHDEKHGHQSTISDHSEVTTISPISVVSPMNLEPAKPEEAAKI